MAGNSPDQALFAPETPVGKGDLSVDLTHLLENDDHVDEYSPSVGIAQRHRRSSISMSYNFDDMGLDVRMMQKVQELLDDLERKEEDFQRAVQIGTSISIENDDLKYENQELKEELGQYKERIQIINEHSANLEEELNRMEDQKRSIEAELQETHHSNQRLKREMAQISESVVEKAKETIEHLSQESQQQTEDFRAQLDLEIEQHAITKKKLSDLKEKAKELKSLRSDLQNSRSENSSLSAKIASIHSEHAQEVKYMDQELTSAIIQRTQLEREFDEMQKSLHAHLDNIANLKRENRELKQTTLEASGGLSNLAAQMGDMLGDLEEEEKEEDKEQEVVQEPKTFIREVPLVIHEYLNLTAAAVKIKFSKKGGVYNTLDIDSEELIRIARDLMFFDMYEYMCNYFEQRKKQKDRELLDIQMEKQGYIDKFSRGQVVAFEVDGKTYEGQVTSLQDNKGRIEVQVKIGRQRRWVPASECRVVQTQGGGEGWFSRWLGNGNTNNT